MNMLNNKGLVWLHSTVISLIFRKGNYSPVITTDEQKIMTIYLIYILCSIY